MFSHIFVGANDFECAIAFYDPLMAVLGINPRFRDASRPWTGWHSAGDSRPLFLIGAPHNQKPHDPGNGQMVAFLACSRQVVRDAYDTALAHGATSEGLPGVRPQYHANYYGAYFRDPDGNKLCVVCHEPEA
jgi:lactoylglutathione lyase